MFIHDHMYRGVHSDVYTVTIEFVVRKNLQLDCAIKVIFVVLRRFCHKRLTGVGQTAFGVRDGPLEKFWGGGGDFRAAGIFFRYQIPCMNFF